MRIARGLAPVIVTCLLLSACVTPEPPATTQPRDGLAYEIVSSLTTEVGARLAGTEKEAEARAWAVARLKALGFQNVREEAFTFPGWQRHHEAVTLVLPSPQRLVASALGGSVSTPRGGLKGDVVLVESHDALLKAPEGSFRGKIVYVNDRMQRTRDGSGYGPAVRKRVRGAVEAARRGAVGVLVRSAGTSHHRFAHTGNMRYDDKVKKIPAASLSGPDADQLERLLKAGGRVSVHMDIRTTLDPKAVSGNVIAELPGTEKSEEIVLMSAHLDSWDKGTGAIDDGAGVAMAMASALRAAGPGLKPKRTIRVVLYGAEEFGAHGGDDYARRRGDEIKRHVLAAEADFGAGAPWRFNTNVPASDLAFFETVHAALAPLGIQRGKLETSGGADIAVLQKAGVPIIAIDQDGTDYFDLHHTDNDTLDKIDPVALEKNVEAYARAIGMVANR
ncbi:MAG: M20/M25/M40 family metallo-hydrolase [Alphaproteobacteria bacterium]|jgi:carboxypeptidase Q